MQDLSVKLINEYSPYHVERENGEYVFETDHHIQYAVSFDPEDVFENLPAYWFNLSNRSGLPSPNDNNIKLTIVCILEEFFRSNPDILLYMCDTADNQQAMRSRLFLRWFNAYGKQKDFYTRTELVEDEGEENYIAIIVKRSHPRLQVIIDLFDEQINLFRMSKP
ncbi:MAG: hypothetical protein IJ546_05000 [Prevotella sp.]|nr:hypothetical protein [Prevotella sp.]